MKTTEQPSHIPLGGVLMLVVLSFLWGANMVTIKVSNVGIPPMLAATIRSVVASFLLWLYARSQGEAVFLPREFFKHGIVIGALFGGEFLVLYWGTVFTDASRAIIFIYTHAIWVALSAHFILHGERLTWGKGLGVLIAFAGLVLVFGSRSASLGPLFWVGDLMELTAGILWAATTIYVKKFIWNTPITHYQTLFAQLFFSIFVLATGWLVFEWGRPLAPTLPVLAAVFYQSVIVAFMSYLAWFWLIHHYQVSRLASFTFLAPLFGVIASGIFLHESLTVFLWIGLAFVAAGIYLVNRPES